MVASLPVPSSPAAARGPIYEDALRHPELPVLEIAGALGSEEELLALAAWRLRKYRGAMNRSLTRS